MLSDLLNCFAEMSVRSQNTHVSMCILFGEAFVVWMQSQILFTNLVVKDSSQTYVHCFKVQILFLPLY